MEWIVCPPGARFVDKNIPPDAQAEDWFYLHVDNAPVTKIIYDGGLCKCPYNDPECEVVLMTFEDFKKHTTREEFKEMKSLEDLYSRLNKHFRDTDAVILPTKKNVETRIENCPVCLCLLGVGFQFHPCHHNFCHSCLERLYASGSNCPMCRSVSVPREQCACWQ